MKRSLIAMATSALVLGGCASKANKVTPNYSSPLKYSKYDCEQISLEVDHLTAKGGELVQAINKQATGDTVAMTVGMVLFWPSLFFLSGGDGPEHVAYASVLGDLEALRRVSVQKKCDVQFPEIRRTQIAESEDDSEYSY